MICYLDILINAFNTDILKFLHYLFNSEVITNAFKQIYSQILI